MLIKFGMNYPQSGECRSREWFFKHALALHCPSGQKYTEICSGQRQKSICRRLKDNLSGCRWEKSARCPGARDREMDAEISEFHETVEGQPGCRFPNFQVFRRCQESHIHNQCDRITEFHLPEAEPTEKRISQWYSPVKSPVSGSLWSHEKMDHADPQLGAGVWGIKHHVWRTSARINIKLPSSTDDIGHPCLTCPSITDIYKARTKSSFLSFSPIIIIEDLYLQTFLHSLICNRTVIADCMRKNTI